MKVDKENSEKQEKESRLFGNILFLFLIDVFSVLQHIVKDVQQFCDQIVDNRVEKSSENPLVLHRL
jgi:DNA-binding ferritin-like protein (Dps family)